MVPRNEELGVAKGLQRTDAQHDLLACACGGLDLPVELPRVEFSRSRFDAIPIRAESDHLKLIGQQLFERGARLESEHGNLRRTEADAECSRVAPFDVDVQ